MFLKKSLGQNFLTSRKVAKEIIELADLNNDDKVLEIGSGAGMLTQFLVEKTNKVISIEIDKRFYDLLKVRFFDHINDKKLTILNEDILKVDLNDLEDLEDDNYKLVGSLPYNISKKIIDKFLQSNKKPKDITVVVQKEVAENYTAKCPKATFLSNYLKIYGNAEIIKIIDKKHFKPIPKVDGAVLKILINDLNIKNKKKFSKFIKSSFINPRKKLINNLNVTYRIDKDKLNDLFRRIGIDRNIRASNLEFVKWNELFKNI